MSVHPAEQDAAGICRRSDFSNASFPKVGRMDRARSRDGVLIENHAVGNHITAVLVVTCAPHENPKPFVWLRLPTHEAESVDKCFWNERNQPIARLKLEHPSDSRRSWAAAGGFRFTFNHTKAVFA
jgi:hypothetical protein